MSEPGAQWCITDPPLTVTVSGFPVTINLFVSLPHDDVSLARQVTASAQLEPGTNNIVVTVTGPPAEWRAQARIESLGLSAGSMSMYSPGETITLRFDNVQPHATS